MTEKYKYLFTYWSSCSLWACCEWVDGRWVGRGRNETLEQCYKAEGLEFGASCVKVDGESSNEHYTSN